jgi:recombination protein RecA
LAKVASRFEAWEPAVEVCTKVQAVPTVFVQLDAITRVAGWPTKRFGMVHGPSNEGKTAFLIGLMLSFLQRGHFASLVDAERTTPATWLEQMMRKFAHHPGFVALRPTTYEATVDAVRQWCTTIGEAKAKGEIDPTTSGIVVVDSLRKLVPKKLLATLLKEGAEEQETKKRYGGSKGVDGLGGRAAQMKAALNAAWLDEMVPLLDQTGTSMIVIARESENPDQHQQWDGEDFKVGGGKAIFYDSSMVVRVLRDGWVRDVNDDGEVTDVGERHCIEIRKTKVGRKEARIPTGYFHTSNGVITPAGFDRTRDVLDLAKREGVVQTHGSWLYWGSEKLGQGEPKALRRLYSEPDLVKALEAAVREQFVLDDSLPSLPPPSTEPAEVVNG